jgi:hypothetical protein
MGWTTQVIGRLEQRRSWIFQVLLSLSLHEAHGRARLDRSCVGIELSAFPQIGTSVARMKNARPMWLSGNVIEIAGII